MKEQPPRRLLSAADAQRVLGIPASTVRSWWRRQRYTGLWDYGRDRRNHPLFDEVDLVALRDRQRRQGRKRFGSSRTTDRQP